MFCSTIIPTVGRATLSRAVMSVLEQSFSEDAFEVIVVNDSGKPLAAADWQRSKRVQVVTTRQRERCVARNTGAAIAQGKYFHFLDDDDWILPGALNSFWSLAQKSDGADWLYGSSQLVDRKGRHLIQLHHKMNGNCFVQAMAGEWFPLQSSCIRAEAFFAVGGFHPLVLATQDIDLCRRIALRGELAGTSDVVACISMGRQGSTTDYERGPIYSRWAREKILSEPGVFARIRNSAGSSDWHGRVSRVYLTSLVWNLRNKHVFTAASRATFGVASLILAGRHVFAPSFWRALIKSYDSPSFARGFQEARSTNSALVVPERVT